MKKLAIIALLSLSLVAKTNSSPTSTPTPVFYPYHLLEDVEEDKKSIFEKFKDWLTDKRKKFKKE